MIRLIAFFSLVLSTHFAFAALKKETVEYKAGTTALEGFIAQDEAPAKSTTGKPAILIVHDWMGLNDHAKEKAEELAKMGYVAFAVDIYGKGVRPQNVEEAKTQATKYKSDIPLLRARIMAAYDKLLTLKNVDPKKVVIIGYCFGGTTALELMRSGAPLAGAGIFHGGLSTPNPKDANNIKGPILVMHGADDPYVPAAEVEAFKKEMKDAKVNMTFISYPKAVHAFTVKAAGNDNSKGAAYNAAADKKSWSDFKKFLAGLKI